MEEIEWNNLTQNNKNNSGCGIIFMFVIVLGIVVLLITVKIVDYFANTPEEQIQRKLPEFERVPPYDPRDNSFQVKKLKESPNGFCCKVFQKIYFSVKLRKKTERTE
ncbi:hypothetical protein LCG89_13735 (plasmid) [Enterococcus faecium]|nr:hypothetical protein LCG89_13735 [Enterococcus faecium]UBQ14180.1 hypothetical protein LCG90_13670 [Enterococcus faecium]